MGAFRAPARGFLAVTSDGPPRTRSADEFDRDLGGDAVDVVTGDGLRTATWGTAPLRPGTDEALVLSASARRRAHEQSPTDVHHLLTADPAALAEVLPTFAAATWQTPDTLVVAADALGFRHIYRSSTQHTAAVSTSAAAAAATVAEASGAALDREALAVQSQLSWQLGQRTLFAGVSKLDAGTLVRLHGGRADSERFLAAPDTVRLPLDRAVPAAAELLRGYLDAYLDDHPDAVLQLTGGLDSRILLSAIRPGRRRGLRVVTLGVPGVPDLAIAAALAERYGMVHEVMSLDGLQDVPAHEAYRMCIDAAVRLDCTADPLAYASLAFAEARAEAGPRISGLGGEVARGFYYLGLDADAPVTRSRAARLAGWRMFANDSVSTEALDPAFADWAAGFARDEVHRVLDEMDKPWFAACDELYLAHRMQRWGGITETAVCMDREVTNPMLDDRFIAIANRVAPQDKRNARFLGRLQVALDTELARIPLENRPAPVAYATTSAANTARRVRSNANKLRIKAIQRLQHTNRPPAGGTILAAKVVEHWRANPTLLEPLAGLGIVDASWLNAALRPGPVPSTSTVAFLVNVLCAQAVVAGRPHERTASLVER